MGVVVVAECLNEEIVVVIVVRVVGIESSCYDVTTWI